jgi:hypothetical protein
MHKTNCCPNKENDSPAPGTPNPADTTTTYLAEHYASSQPIAFQSHNIYPIGILCMSNFHLHFTIPHFNY